MRIGVPKEIKNHEHRVAITPQGVATLVADGHKLIVQRHAGLGSGYCDQDYIQAGASLLATAAEVWDCDLVVKVKEPLESEYDLLGPDFSSNLMLFTFLHLAAAPQLARALMDKNVCAIGYETVQLDDGRLPILAAMSQIAGRVAAQLAVRFLQKENGTAFAGKGQLAGAVANSRAANVIIIGAGQVGLHAADALAGLGARVTLLEANQGRVQALLKSALRDHVSISHFSNATLQHLLLDCDILIGAALIAGKHAPELLKRSDFKAMQAGSVFIDVAIDQGGISESSHATTYDEPVYLEEGVIHCCLPNLPAAVPLSSTQALTEASLPYIQLIAKYGIDGAAQMDTAIARAINIRHGCIVHADVAESLAASLAS